MNLSEGENSFRQWDQKCECDETLPNTIKMPKDLKKLEKTFQKLWNTPQPEQRTKEWFDFRYNRITASDTAAALDENPYEPVESFILKKSAIQISHFVIINFVITERSMNLLLLKYMNIFIIIK